MSRLSLSVNFLLLLRLLVAQGSRILSSQIITTKTQVPVIRNVDFFCAARSVLLREVGNSVAPWLRSTLRLRKSQII
jgi:hypothetical protein